MRLPVVGYITTSYACTPLYTTASTLHFSASTFCTNSQSLYDIINVGDFNGGKRRLALHGNNIAAATFIQANISFSGSKEVLQIVKCERLFKSEQLPTTADS